MTSSTTSLQKSALIFLVFLSLSHLAMGIRSSASDKKQIVSDNTFWRN
jgi:hypothetical protein